MPFTLLLEFEFSFSLRLAFFMQVSLYRTEFSRFLRSFPLCRSRKPFHKCPSRFFSNFSFHSRFAWPHLKGFTQSDKIISCFLEFFQKQSFLSKEDWKNFLKRTLILRDSCNAFKYGLFKEMIFTFFFEKGKHF